MDKANIEISDDTSWKDNYLGAWYLPAVEETGKGVIVSIDL